MLRRINGDDEREYAEHNKCQECCLVIGCQVCGPCVEHDGHNMDSVELVMAAEYWVTHHGKSMDEDRQDRFWEDTLIDVVIDARLWDESPETRPTYLDVEDVQRLVLTAKINVSPSNEED